MSDPAQRHSSDATPRLLFVPVSGEFGMGEYARSLAIAQGVRARWPGASIHFVISRRAPYAKAAPFPATLLDSSPTFHTAAVVEVIRTWRPDVVIFDNAGRTAQIRAAKRGGARVVYISARRRQRAKAFRLRWMRLIDEHWIAYPPFIAGRLGYVERLKLRVMGRPQVRYLDVILSRPDAGAVGGGSEVAVGNGGEGAAAGDGSEGAAAAYGSEVAVGNGGEGAAAADGSEGAAAGDGSEVVVARGGNEVAAGCGHWAVASGDEVLDATPGHGGIVARLGCVSGQYTLLVPGGGTGHPRTRDAVSQFLQAARELAAAGVPTVCVGKTPPERAAATDAVEAAGIAVTGSVNAIAGASAAARVNSASTDAAAAAIDVAAALDAAAASAACAPLRVPGLLPQSELAQLMRGARLIVTNGGSTLLQAIACRKPCIGVAMAGDQAERIRRCVGAGVAVAAPLDASAIYRRALDLLRNEPARRALSARAAALGLTDGVEVAIRAMTPWLESHKAPAR